MNSSKLPLSSRARLALLKGVARMIAWALAPALKPATVAAEHSKPYGGRVLDGEFRRIDERNVTTRW